MYTHEKISGFLKPIQLTSSWVSRTTEAYTRNIISQQYYQHCNFTLTSQLIKLLLQESILPISKIKSFLNTLKGLKRGSHRQMPPPTWRILPVKNHIFFLNMNEPLNFLLYQVYEKTDKKKN